MIKIKNSYIESVDSKGVLQNIIRKGFTAKTSYWLATIFIKLEEASKIYFGEKKKLIDKHAMRDDKDEVISDGRGTTLRNPTAFNDELIELLEIEIDLGVKKVNFDLDMEPKCTIEEMGLLLPLIEVV